MKKLKKSERHRNLVEYIKRNPFVTDEELAQVFGVSVPTIRLDRLELNIAEYRERIRSIAQGIRGKSGDAGEVVYLKQGVEAFSIFETNEGMLLKNTGFVKGSSLYALAESLAEAVCGEDATLVEVANIKYKQFIGPDVRLTARAEVRRTRGDEHIVWVKVYDGRTEVFAAKCILKKL